jgi:hypothetical protein
MKRMIMKFITYKEYNISFLGDKVRIYYIPTAKYLNIYKTGSFPTEKEAKEWIDKNKTN